ncbi:MAG: hypothetical protein LBR10_11960, partial [Prevotellaceae bacterium]|nr:hypothetical protein [Prevotellaceae bacterium]
NHYTEREGYYDFDSFIILYAFLVLLRIKSMEQTKMINPGELGKLIGYDRIPETKKLRGLIKELTQQKKSSDWGASLSGDRIKEDKPELYYIDGHVQVYHGYLANLGKKHVSRQRLCLPGMMEFWVNSVSGNPFFFITARVNEKMMEMLEEEIIPQLIKLHKISARQAALMAKNTNYPRFTPVFDREAYSPAFFKRLWDTYRIAILTYRKNVKEQWAESVFEETAVDTSMGNSTTVEVVNREYTNITSSLRKEREKLSRRKAGLYELEQSNPADTDRFDKEKKIYLNKELKLNEEITQIQSKIDELIAQRKKIPYKITIAQMPEEVRYNKLNQESKHLQNIIKMICLRAETTFANLLAPHYKRSEDEIRALVKAITNQTVDLFPDYQNSQLCVTLYPLANQRSNEAVKNVIDFINLTKTVYSGTSLILNFKITTV